MARGPLRARVRGAGDSLGFDSGPLGQGPAVRRALAAGHIPAPERALDLRGCTLGPQLSPPPSLPAGTTPPLTSPLSISLRLLPPRGGGLQDPLALVPPDLKPPAGRPLPNRAAPCPPRGPRAATQTGAGSPHGLD